MPENIIKKIVEKFQTNKTLYIGEKVTIAEHMIQTAMIAEKNKSSESLICASLLHDYGHFIIEHPNELVAKSVDGKHEYIGYNFLKIYFKPEVTEPIKLHVQAKRYLCREKSYYDLLSKAAKISLKFQGGKMTDDEAKNFILLKYYKEAIKLRKFDEEGKLPDTKIKNINDYAKIIKNHLLSI